MEKRKEKTERRSFPKLALIGWLRPFCARFRSFRKLKCIFTNRLNFSAVFSQKRKIEWIEIKVNDIFLIFSKFSSRSFSRFLGALYPNGEENDRIRDGINFFQQTSFSIFPEFNHWLPYFWQRQRRDFRIRSWNTSFCPKGFLAFGLLRVCGWD